MAKRIKKQTVEEISEISPVFDKDRFTEGGYVDEINKDWFAPEDIWDIKVPDIPVPEVVEPEVEEEDTQESLPITAFLPAEELRQVRTRPHASVYNSANRDDRAHNIHLSEPNDFVVFARAVKDKHSRTRFYQVAEGALNNLWLDISDILSTIALD